MRRLLAFAVAALAVAGWWLSPSLASASTLADCLARQHVCVNSDSRALVSQAQEAQLQRQIGGADVYLIVAASDQAGYDSAMTQIIGMLKGHGQFTVGFMDSRLMNFGAYNKGMLPDHGAADIATEVVAQHRADKDIYAALTDFVADVQKAARSGSVGAAGTSSPALTTVLIGAGVIVVLIVSGIFLVGRPIRRRLQRELAEAKTAAQDDLIALSTTVTDLRTDASVQGSAEAAKEQGAALDAYERGTRALDAARRAREMGAVSRAIAEGHYHVACATALANGQPRPGRGQRASSTLGTACRYVTCSGRRRRTGPAARFRPASTALTRWSRESNRRYARSRCAVPLLATSIPVSPPRTGAATVSVLACSPGSCSGRRSRRATSAVEVSAAEASAAAGFGGGSFGGGSFGGGSFGGGSFGGGGGGFGGGGFS